MISHYKFIQQEGNSNIDCIPRAGKPKSAHTGGGGLSQNVLCPGTLTK